MLTATAPVGIQVIGYGSYTSYQYPGGLNLTPSRRRRPRRTDVLSMPRSRRSPACLLEMRYAPTNVSLGKAFVLGIWGLVFVTLALALAGCDGKRPPPHDVDGGQGGEGGCPLLGAEPLYVLDIRADDGPVPPDTRVAVAWSAGEEPPFVLSEPATWKTLDDGVNLVCLVDWAAAPPLDLSSLVCELWASGAVDVRVEASAYAVHEETLEPVLSERCGAPMPMKVAVVLSRAMLDGGVAR